MGPSEEQVSEEFNPLLYLIFDVTYAAASNWSITYDSICIAHSNSIVEATCYHFHTLSASALKKKDQIKQAFF